MNDLFCITFQVEVDPMNNLNGTEKLMQQYGYSKLSPKKFEKLEGIDLNTVEFLGKKILSNYYLDEITNQKRNKSFLSFIKLLKELSELYSIKMNSLYDDLIGILSPMILMIRQDYLLEEAQDVRLDTLGSSNAILSIELRNMLLLKHKSDQESLIYKKFFDEIFKKFVNKNDLSYLSQLGVKEQTITEIFEIMKQ